MPLRCIVLLLCCTAAPSLKSQVYHELGVGFSGLRIWEPEPPGLFTQDLDYYLNPQLSYQLHFLDEKAVVGLQFGWVYAKGLKDEENYFREDIQKSLNLDLEMGINLIKFSNSFLQWTAGTRLTKSSFYSIEIVDCRENRNSYSIRDEQWQDVNFDLTSAISYQLNLSDKRYRSTSLALRISLDLVYFFPVNHEYEYLEEKYRFAMGPSASLIWRIRGKKNRGLF